MSLTSVSRAVGASRNADMAFLASRGYRYDPMSRLDRAFYDAAIIPPIEWLLTTTPNDETSALFRLIASYPICLHVPSLALYHPDEMDL